MNLALPLSGQDEHLFLQWSNGPNEVVCNRKDFLSCHLWQLCFTFKWPHVQHFGYRMICTYPPPGFLIGIEDTHSQLSRNP
ncbi:Katanin-Interacting Protein [Manis pentadactyla]|nr:Katanin-Interacting Protein [Manis pentadactyla]